VGGFGVIRGPFWRPNAQGAARFGRWAVGLPNRGRGAVFGAFWAVSGGAPRSAQGAEIRGLWPVKTTGNRGKSTGYGEFQDSG